MTNEDIPRHGRPWHCPPPAPWPHVKPSDPVTHAELAALVTAASERHVLRMHGAAR